jgi:hypothetical protein
MQREIKMPDGHGEKVRKSLLGKTGNASRAWKGVKAGYVAKHSWIKKHCGKAHKCENEECLYKNPKRYEWANVSGEYRREREDYMMLCPSCHRKKDMTPELREKIIKNLKYVK